MKENELKVKACDSILSNNLEETLAGTIMQSLNFVDQVVIEVSEDTVDRKELIKNLINLKSFMQNSIFEYKLKTTLKNRIDGKKKEEKKLESQKELLEQSQNP